MNEPITSIFANMIYAFAKENGYEIRELVQHEGTSISGKVIGDIYFEVSKKDEKKKRSPRKIVRDLKTDY